MVTTMVAATIRAPSLSSGFEGRGGGGPGGADMLAGLDCRNRVRDWSPKKVRFRYASGWMLEEPRAQRNDKLAQARAWLDLRHVNEILASAGSHIRAQPPPGCRSPSLVARRHGCSPWSRTGICLREAVMVLTGECCRSRNESPSGLGSGFFRASPGSMAATLEPRRRATGRASRMKSAAGWPLKLEFVTVSEWIWRTCALGQPAASPEDEPV